MTVSSYDMTTVAIKINPDNLDDVRLIIKGDVPQIIKLKDRGTVYKLSMDVWTLYYMVHSDHHEEFPLEIDGIVYRLPLNACHAIMNVLCDEWLGDFIDAEYPDGAPEDPPELGNLSFHERVAVIGKTENDKKAIECLEKADRLYKQGEREKAIAIYAEAIVLDPQLLLAYKNLGLTAGELSQFDMALDNFNKVIEMEAEDAVNYRHRGAIYYYLKLFDEALSDFNKAINIDESFADAYYWRGLTNLESSPIQSVEDFSTSIELNPGNDQCYLDRACAHAMLGNYTAAKIDLVSSIEINPGNTLAHEHLEIFNELLDGKIDGIEVKRKT
jgi:tetratricopeptide (TPR) repeat protein